MWVTHNVLQLWLRHGSLASSFRIYFWGIPVITVAPMLGATLVQRLSGCINSRPSDIWQVRCRKWRSQRLSMMSLKQIIVKSTTSSTLLHCDVIGNIQHYQSEDGIVSSSKCSMYFPWYLRFLPEILHRWSPCCHQWNIQREKSSKVTSFSKISVFATVSLIILFKFLFDVFSPWLDPCNGPP